MKSLILAGGYGKRLKPLTDDRPKPMIEVLDRPILAWQLLWLKMNGIYDVILCVGYKKEVIMDYISKNVKDMNIQYSIENEPLGTGGAIKNAYDLLLDDDTFIVVNGDIITDLSIGMMVRDSIAVVPLPSPYGIVETESSSNPAIIRGFKEKPVLDGFWINAGVYCLSNDIFRYLPEKGSIEYDTFPILVKEDKLYAVKYKNAYWRSIDTYKDVEEASKELAVHHSRYR